MVCSTGSDGVTVGCESAGYLEALSPALPRGERSLSFKCTRRHATGRAVVPRAGDRVTCADADACREDPCRFAERVVRVHPGPPRVRGRDHRGAVARLVGRRNRGHHRSISLDGGKRFPAHAAKQDRAACSVTAQRAGNVPGHRIGVHLSSPAATSVARKPRSARALLGWRRWRTFDGCARAFLTRS